MVPDTQPVIVASHPRSGTHLLIDLLRRHFPACKSWKWPGERLDRLYCNIDELNGTDGLLSEAKARSILMRTDRPIVKTHSFPEYQEGFLETHQGHLSKEWSDWIDNQGTSLYVYRDGRDVLCSYQLFRQSFDVTARCAIGDFLRQKDKGMNRVQRWKRHVRSWMDDPSVHLFRFEDIIQTPSSVIKRIGEVADMQPEIEDPLLPPPFESIWESRKARIFYVRPTSTAIINEKSKDWAACFTQADREFFQREAGDLLSELGYIDSDDWVEAK